MGNKLTEKEIEQRIEECPFKDGECCDRYTDCKIPCDGACSWVLDYAQLRDIKNRLNIS